MSIRELEKDCEQFLESLTGSETDSAHDMEHIRRVVNNGKKILASEDADTDVVIAACWLHDCVILPKNHPNRSRASGLAAVKAGHFLMEYGFADPKIDAVKHAIEAHSFSAGIPAKTIEAMIVQDADRLDAIGAIGIARALLVGGKLDRPLYHPSDPLCENRKPDDGRYTIDHFFQKLFKLPGLMNTSGARQIAERRVSFMKRYLDELNTEIRSE